MGRNYWMFVDSPEIFETNRKLGFKLYGVAPRYRRRAERMQPDDRVLFYVNRIRKWVAAATIRSRSFEDHSPVWGSERAEIYPYRIKLAPDIVLDEADYIDALILAPRLEYVKRWAPEEWPLAFFDRLHLLPQRDFRLIEGEMKRIASRGRGNRPWRQSGSRDRRARHPNSGQDGRSASQGHRGPRRATVPYQDGQPVGEGTREGPSAADSHLDGGAIADVVQEEEPTVDHSPDVATGDVSVQPGVAASSEGSSREETPVADSHPDSGREGGPIPDGLQEEEPTVDQNWEVPTNEDVPG